MKNVRTTKIRILQVTPGLWHGGGVSKWLLETMRKVDPERFQFDFLPMKYAYRVDEGSGESEIIARGGAVYHCPEIRKKIPCGKEIRNILKNNYDVIDVHNLFQGSVFWLAKTAGINIRVMHVHNDVGHSLTSGSLPGRMLRHLQLKLIKKYATHGLAVSNLMGKIHFGRCWGNDPRWQRMLLGIDTAPFRKYSPKPNLRKELGIPETAKVVGHVGQFNPQKNHKQLIEIFEQVSLKDDNAYLLCIGDGARRTTCADIVAKKGLTNKVRFTGVRKDVSDLMLNVMDVFCLPSFYEGLPLSMLESQAAGLPAIVSDHITTDATINHQLINRLPLEASPQRWADSVLQALYSAKSDDHQKKALDLFEKSPFTLEKSVDRLVDFYENVISSNLQTRK